MRTLKKHWLRILVHIGALLPLVLILWDLWGDRFLVDPVREITTRTGRAALTLLILSLACTPINIVFGFRKILRARRPLGLYAFLYAALHFLTFAGWDYAFNLRLLGPAIFKQRFVVPGFISLLILLALAITSTRRWQEKLGKRWKLLQRSVYVANLLVILHLLWLAKAPQQALRYGALVVFLLLLRIPPIKKVISKTRKLLESKLKL